MTAHPSADPAVFAELVSAWEDILALLDPCSADGVAPSGPASADSLPGGGRPTLQRTPAQAGYSTEGASRVSAVGQDSSRCVVETSRPVPSTTRTGTPSSCSKSERHGWPQHERAEGGGRVGAISPTRPPAEAACPTSRLGHSSREVPA
jgi:hypothetical protein